MYKTDWNINYNTNIKEIDEQHQKLVFILNELIDSFRKRTTKIDLEVLINSLIDYTYTHFSEEEMRMTQYDYKEYQSHKNQHEIFTNKITDIKTKFDNGETYLKLDLLLYLKDWFIKHICSIDKKLADFILAQTH